MAETRARALRFWQKTVGWLQSRKEKWLLAIFLTVYTPLFLIFFQPFGVNNYDPTHRISLAFLLACIAFGLVAGLTILLFEFVISPFLFRKHQLSLSIFILRLFIELTLLASAIFLFYNILGNFHDWRLKSYLEFIRHVSIMGIIPMGIILLFLEYRKLRKEYKEAHLASEAGPNGTKLIRLNSDNGKEHLSLAPGDILYIEAQGNYVFVYHLENGQVKKSLLRTTMKRLEKQLRVFSILRCHRSFLVNIEKVNKASGNAHQLQIHLPGIPESIPVSRSYIPTLERYLDVHPV